MQPRHCGRTVASGQYGGGSANEAAVTRSAACLYGWVFEKGLFAGSTCDFYDLEAV